MAAHISRRQLAAYVVDQLSAGKQLVLKQLAAYIIENHLTRQLDLIMNEIEAEYARRGKLVANITSAHALDDASRRELAQFITEMTGAKSVQFREEVNAKLIGGVVIETPGKYFDGSIASQLHQLKVNA